MSKVLTACMTWPFGRSCVTVQSGETLLAATIEDRTSTSALQNEDSVPIKHKDLFAYQDQLFRKTWNVTGKQLLRCINTW